ncbi:MAG: ribosome-associated translation inhibitor RaiA [Oscillospiraceae bacterium]|nr:ribosome-associated translation inhibitor RaiA [Oscillospiraceae bacterium]
MIITVVGKKCTPRDSFKERADKKLAKLDKFFGDEASAKVTAAVEKKYQIVEVTIDNNGMFFRAQAKAENMNDALDKCVDLLIRQIRKNKTKLEKRFRSGSLDDVIAESVAAEEIEDEAQYNVIRTKVIPLKPQSVDEAILQMNMLGHKFYMFRNSADNSVALVYSREDGGYGLITPQE